MKKIKLTHNKYALVNYKTINLGYFKTKEKAYEAYCKACIKYHGKFANFG